MARVATFFFYLIRASVQSAEVAMMAEWGHAKICSLSRVLNTVPLVVDVYAVSRMTNMQIQGKGGSILDHACDL